MNNSVFPFRALSRDVIQWENYLDEPTPVELRNGRYYKREDYFAPLGYGRINGSKLRQLLYLIDGYVKAGGDRGILTGASVLSPQLSMAATVAKHYGLDTTIVLGGTTRDSAIRHDNVRIAVQNGARIHIAPIGYNPALQKTVATLHASPEYRGWYRLNYGITTEAGAEDAEIEHFHRFGADQTRTIPDDVEVIGVPAGSCNSVTSVLYGIARERPKSLRKIVLFGIGPTRLDWIQTRLEAIERATGLSLRSAFRYDYVHHPELSLQHNAAVDFAGEIDLVHHDLHATKFSAYQDRFRWSEDGIDFHPTYEGKMMTYIDRNKDSLLEFQDRDGRALIWIVGSYPSNP